MQTKIFYLIQVIPNLCTDLKAPIYPIAENILFVLFFPNCGMIREATNFYLLFPNISETAMIQRTYTN
jgi:hypothetical protein